MEDGDDRTQEIALDEVEPRRSVPPPLPSRRVTPIDGLEPEGSDRPTEPPVSSGRAARLGRSLVPPPLAPAVAAPRAETPRSSRATVKLKPAVVEGAPRPSVPPPLATGLARDVTPPPAARMPPTSSRAPTAPSATRSMPTVSSATSTAASSASSPSSAASSSASSPSSAASSSASSPSSAASSSASSPSSAASSSASQPPSAASSSAVPQSVSSTSSRSQSASGTSSPAASPSAGTSSPSTSASPSSAGATPALASTASGRPRPTFPERAPAKTLADRPTTTSLADAALQARLRHVEALLDERPKLEARLARLEGDPRFDALASRVDALEARHSDVLDKLDATVASVASALDRLAQLERHRDDPTLRARLDRALDLASAALEATRSNDSRLHDHEAQVQAATATLDVLRSRLEPLERVASTHDPATHEGLDRRLSALERVSDAALRGRVEAMEARLVSLVARFADIAARAPSEGRASLLPPAPSATTSLGLDALEERIRAVVLAELEGARAASPRGDATEGLRAVKGIGPAFAERLRTHGIVDVTTLAALSDDRIPELAREVGAPTAKLRKWRDAARAL